MNTPATRGRSSALPVSFSTTDASVTALDVLLLHPGGPGMTPVWVSAGIILGGFRNTIQNNATNSLIISAPEPVYRQMRQVIDQLDTRRAQVYVETMIVKVDAAKAAQFGVQWQGILGSTSNNTIGYVGTNYGSTGNIANLTLAQFAGTSTSSTSSSSTSTAASLNQGINIGILNKINGAFTLGALANFLQTQTGANVLSTPNLVALDNEEAKIVIGSNVPFVTGSYTNTGGSSNSVNPFQTVERKDVGIVLRIKSQIGEGGTIRMTVYQENSTLRTDGSSITDKSSIETSVVVDDGQTMVLGGLLKDEYGDADNKVPLLGSIPLVGRLFSSDNRTRTKTDLMLFLRPVIIRDNASMDKLVVDRYDAIRAVQQNAQPEKDILLLAQKFGEGMARELGREYFAGFSPVAERQLLDYQWPGNVRELRNILERAGALFVGRAIDFATMAGLIRPGQPIDRAEEAEAIWDAVAEFAEDPVVSPENPDADEMPARPVDIGVNHDMGVRSILSARDGFNLKDYVSALEIAFIRVALEDEEGSVSAAARRLGIQRTTLIEKMRKFGIGRPD